MHFCMLMVRDCTVIGKFLKGALLAPFLDISTKRHTFGIRKEY